jgi:biopolymer transport protein ExbD
MAMSVGSSDDGGMMMEMNTTPLIDVMLVLIVMLIITIPIQTHAVKLDMPRPTINPPPVQPEVIDLVVDFDGTLLWNGVVIPNAETLLNYFQEASVKQPQPELHLRPNKLAKYDVVANVLATAQRLHINNIGIVGNELMEQ